MSRRVLRTRSGERCPAWRQPASHGEVEILPGGVPCHPLQPGAPHPGAPAAGGDPAGRRVQPRLIGVAQAVSRAADAGDQGGLERPDRRRHRCGDLARVAGVDPAYRPAIRSEAREARRIGRSNGRNDGDPSKAPRAGKVCGFLDLAGRQFAAAAQDPAPVIDEGAAEPARQHAFGQRQAGGAPDRLRGHLHQPVARSEQRRRGLAQRCGAARQHQPVAVAPERVGRIEPQVPREQQCSGQAQRLGLRRRAPRHGERVTQRGGEPGDRRTPVGCRSGDPAGGFSSVQTRPAPIHPAAICEAGVSSAALPHIGRQYRASWPHRLQLAGGSANVPPHAQ